MNALLLTLWVPLALSAGYLLVFALAGRLRRLPTPSAGDRLRTAVLIPAYREDAVIVETARQALAQNYPADRFDVIVIADGLQAETHRRLLALGVTVLTVRFERSTKAKALRAAMEAFPPGLYETVVVLDADNVMAPDALARLDDARTEAEVVQGQRVAKNLDTPLARLDALSEAVNNHVFRRGHAALGLSAALIGSGMAFDAALFARLMARAEAVGGFDKELELALTRSGTRIAYASEAVIYDEKVSAPEVFVRQRRRWLAAQAHYAGQHLRPALVALVRTGNADYADKALQMILPPRALLLGAVPALGALALVTSASVIPWVGLGLALALAIGLGIPASLGRGLLGDVLYLPRALALMLRAGLTSRGANRTFLHTPHTAAHVTAQP
ncbi:MAG: glycosyltransferase family 2 protein [Bacteroidota bacterium]